MLRPFMAIAFGFMTLWHGPAMALAALNAPVSHHHDHGAADTPGDHPHHAPALPSDAAGPCSALSCCIAPVPEAPAAAIRLTLAAALQYDTATVIVSDDPSPPVPPPRLPA